VSETGVARAPIGSARSVLLTLFGDAVLPTGGEAWLGTVSTIAEDLGIEATATRQALRRLTGQGLLTSHREGRRARYALTAAGRRRLQEAADRIYLRRPLAWDGRWQLLTWPSRGEQRRRSALRRELRWLGYGELDDHSWICPWDLGSRLDAVLAKHDVDATVHRFSAELSGDDRELVARAYDLRELRTGHRAFLDDIEGVIPPSDDDRAALRWRLELVHRWRKLLFLDPGLPAELVPHDWLGERAGEVFLAGYRRVEAAGWRHYFAVAAATDPSGSPPAWPSSNLVVGVRPLAPRGDETAMPPEHAADATAAPAPDATAAQRQADDSTPTRTGHSQDRAGSGDDPVREQAFLTRLHGGHKVEATDWMPSTYRRLNIKFVEMHANSEIMGALPEREWIARAPSLTRKRSLAAKVQDEVGHAHLIYRVAESLGRSRTAMYEDLVAGRGKFHNVFHYPTYTWGDVACIGFLVDGAAIVTQRALLETSYAPYVRVMRRVVAEESLHYRHGEDIMLALASGTDEQFQMLQEAVVRWWEPVMHFFGTDVAYDDDPMIHWGVKTRTNEQSRQEWIAQYVPKLWDMGIETPDPALAYDPDAETWTYTEPDWERLRALLTGPPTPSTASRLWWRQLLHRHHAWVREVVSGDAVPAAA
jgi:ring-1,2-phenylacetyl-CoA epoxidase subunit PaaA